MKVNGVDIRKYKAKQLKADPQPPAIAANYEWITGALLPTELEAEVEMGSLKLSIYFKGKDRSSIIRHASEFMSNFTCACDMELDGYKGMFKGFITANDYEKTIAKNRYIINLEFDGYFYDDEVEMVLDGKTAGEFYTNGTRCVPCVLEVYAKSALTNYTVKGLGSDDITIESLATGKSIFIDGRAGLVTMNGVNAFDKINMWEFPKLSKGKTSITCSNTRAIIKIRYVPMWI